MKMPLPIECQAGPCEGEEKFFRADGGCLCPSCSRPYRVHPYCANSALPESTQCSSISKEYILHVLCNGDHVKL